MEYYLAKQKSDWQAKVDEKKRRSSEATTGTSASKPTIVHISSARSPAWENGAMPKASISTATT